MRTEFQFGKNETNSGYGEWRWSHKSTNVVDYILKNG